MLHSFKEETSPAAAETAKLCCAPCSYWGWTHKVWITIDNICDTSFHRHYISEVFYSIRVTPANFKPWEAIPQKVFKVLTYIIVKVEKIDFSVTSVILLFNRPHFERRLGIDYVDVFEKIKRIAKWTYYI